MHVYPPPTVEAQLNLIGSHDTPRVLNVMGGDRAAVRLAMLLLLTLPGAPNIYYGDEIAMEGGDDPDCRRSFPADPDAGDREMRALVKALLTARHANEALRRGSAEVVATGATSVAILRDSGGQRAIVALNPGDSTDHLVVPGGSLPPGFATVTLPSWSAAAGVRHRTGDDGSLSIELPAQAGAILLSQR
jgi:glycosidase